MSMKKLIIINGTMGVGKSSASKELAVLMNGLYLDGDWCWRPAPLCKDKINRDIIIENMGKIISYELSHMSYEALIYCWVIPENDILLKLLGSIEGAPHKTFLFTLIPTKEALISRLRGDIEKGVRDEYIVERALNHLVGYKAQDTIKIDNTLLSPKESAKAIYDYISKKAL